MNLGLMTRTGVNPGRVHDSLSRHFESADIVAGVGIWQYSMICRDEEGAPRLVVNYFITVDGRWIYSIEGIRSEKGRDLARRVAQAIPHEMPLALAA